MLEKTILNVAINIIYLGPSINGAYSYWVRDFTNKLYRHYNGSSLDRMRTRDKVCLYMPNFIFFFFFIFFMYVSSWPLSVLVFPGLMPHMISLLNFNILCGGGCMLIDVNLIPIL